MMKKSMIFYFKINSSKPNALLKIKNKNLNSILRVINYIKNIQITLIKN